MSGSCRVSSHWKMYWMSLKIQWKARRQSIEEAKVVKNKDKFILIDIATEWELGRWYTAATKSQDTYLFTVAARNLMLGEGGTKIISQYTWNSIRSLQVYISWLGYLSVDTVLWFFFFFFWEGRVMLFKNFNNVILDIFFDLYLI